MAYDTMGRWVPSEDLTWSTSTEKEKADLRLKLIETGLDWRHQGKAPEFSDTRSARMPAFFEHANTNLPSYA